MAHVLCITSGMTGIVNASLEVASRLRGAGHRVTYACPHDARATVEANGFTYRQLPPVNFDPSPVLAREGEELSLPRKAIRAVRTRRDRLQVGAENLRMGPWVRLLDGEEPDLVLIDMELHEHVITAVSKGRRVLLLSQWFCTQKRRGLPPIQSPVVPGAGPLGGRPGLEVEWLRYRAGEGLRILREGARTVFTRRRSVLRYYARSVGFPLDELEELNWPPPFTYRSLPVVSMTAEELEFPHQRRPAFEYVGPMVFAGRIDVAVDRGNRAVFERIVRESRAAGRKLVLCTVSSMQSGDVPFLRRVVRATADRPEWTLVMGLGGNVAPEALGDLSENVHAYPWIPLVDLLEHADLSINHAGIHSINECIHHAVPMLVYSGGRQDQDGCASRIAYHGLGIRGDTEGDSPAEIASRIERALNDEGVRSRVEALSRACQTEQRRGRLAEIVERRLRA